MAFNKLNLKGLLDLISRDWFSETGLIKNGTFMPPKPLRKLLYLDTFHYKILAILFL